MENKVELIIYFSADGKYEVTLMTKARLNYTGEIEWKPPAIYKSSCKINVEWFPFVRTQFSQFYMFSRILNFLFVIGFWEESRLFDQNNWHFIIYHFDKYLNKNLFRTDQSKREISWGEKADFVESGFATTCDQLVTGRTKLWHEIR